MNNTDKIKALEEQRDYYKERFAQLEQLYTEIVRESTSDRNALVTAAQTLENAMGTLIQMTPVIEAAIHTHATGEVTGLYRAVESFVRIRRAS